ncbi:MAG: DUF3365 domain-containing protein [Vitreoscilla sp.]|nr:DUF3365 domain-containing protein [Burkholderiales bacterium]MBP6338353.1 DUF3365 domain-containing protein [Vitreoscilla sp.]MBP6676182.1 DUF3365 domain-containing protein [Vitreoscilla sp.]
MRHIHHLCLIMAGLGCASATWAADEAWVSEARGVATALPPKLLAVLKTEIDQGGLEQAIGACNEKAPQMGKAASEQSGWQVRRVSLRQRNPKAVPDAWESAVLADFDRRAAAGESPATLERAEVVSNDQGKPQYRYLRALPVQELCTSCHGDAKAMNPGVKAKLATLYPHDQAVGYSPGQIRGAVALKKSVP